MFESPTDPISLEKLPEFEPILPNTNSFYGDAVMLKAMIPDYMYEYTYITFNVKT